MLDLYLFRHAESVLNADGTIIGGRSNHVELTPRGRSQALLLADRLMKSNIKFDEIYVSPSVRTVETAKIACAYIHELILPRVRFEIQELNQGDWQGRVREEIYTPAVRKQLTEDWTFKPPNGESRKDVEERMYSFIERFIGRDVTIGIFGHGMAIKCLLRKVMEYSPSLTYRVDIDNTSVTRLSHDERGWHVRCINDTSHLNDFL